MTTLSASGVRPRGGFGLFWASQAAGAAGDRLSGFTAPTVAILVLGASDAEVGVVAAAGWLAYPAVGLLAGALLARARVRRVVVGAELVRFTAFAAIAAAVVCGWLTSVVPLVAAVALAGVATVFVDLGNQVQLPALVPAGRLVGANSRLQGTDSASKLAGPALGGAAVGALGPAAALALGALPFLLSASCRARVPAPTVAAPVAAPAGREPVALRVRDGLRFTCRHPVLGPLVTSGAVRALGTGAVDAVLLLFAYRVLGMSAAGTGLLLAAGAAGALVGVLCVGPLVNALGPRRALLASVAEGLTWCAVPLCLVLPAPVPVLFAIRVLSAFWTPAWGVVGTSVRQRLAPPERQAAVHGTTRVLVSSAIPLGSLGGGLVAGAASGPLGPPTALACVIVAGGLCIAGSALLLPSHIPADRPNTPREDRCTRRPAGS
ncbi:MFS transporter [Saccharothrix yanglingensis]|nr:MFS transporter [Saccharothrix yanglingensis]